MPAGASSVLLCRYAGLGQGPSGFGLLAQHDVSAAATVANLVSLLNRLHPQSSHPISCPLDNGTEMLAFFSYPTKSALRLTISLSGCEVITNGHVARTASLPPGATLLARLTQLVA